MKICSTPSVPAFMACFAAIGFGAMPRVASAQETAKLPYLNTGLTPVERATDLVHRMTLAEKASEMQNNSAAVPRRNISAYTTFQYAGLSVPTQPVAAGQPVGADVTVTNTGKVAGDESVQLYLKFLDVKGAPKIALRGFQRNHIEPVASQKVHFDRKKRDLEMVTEDGNPVTAPGEYTVSIGGRQPDTAAPSVSGHFHIEGQVDLPG